MLISVPLKKSPCLKCPKKRHDLAIEKLQKAHVEWAHKRQERIETKFTELKEVMRECHEVFGHELPPLSREPILSDFYTPIDDHHY